MAMGELIEGSATTLEMSPEIGELAAALAMAQAEFTAVNKGRTAKVQTKAGGEYSYSYADLADVAEMIRPVLGKHGLAVVHLPAPAAPHEIALRTMLVHKSGQWLAGVGSMPCDTSKPQSIGSAITYLRRYQLAPMLNIVTDDDDDGHAAGHAPAGHRQQQQGGRGQWGGHQANGRPPQQQQQQANRGGGDRQYSGPPKHGRGLFAWAKKEEDGGARGLVDWLNGYGADRQWPDRMTAWDEGQTREAYDALNSAMAAQEQAPAREPGDDDPNF